MREPKKLVLRKVKRKGYYRNIKDKNGKIIGRTWVEPGKVNAWVVSNAWKKWRIEEDKRIARAEDIRILKEYIRIINEQIERWQTGWLRAEFRDRNTGQKFYYKDVLTFKQFVIMRKREKRIDSIIKSVKTGYIKSIKYKHDIQSIRESRESMEIAIQKAERIKMSKKFISWVRSFLPPK